ncbi:response regulator receiver protein [Anabaenopsis circularis NIES-21]|uniref:Response regulator receiver protein n=1 Tax=Anabaenopsis circularis NIES-21 TaxID=1085406 RepID=A0A1Z4GKR5_9CYAN|nr:response regulator receiver protein [Anabaenopsis circularis NIES-21]
MLKIFFEAEGSEVKTVASFGNALDVMRYFQPDILISEIYLPDEAAYSLLTQVRDLEAKRRKYIPAIALTSFTTDKDRMYALKVGFQMYLSKPIDLDELADLVANLSRSKQLNTPVLGIN